jgi:hypothetical protein
MQDANLVNVYELCRTNCFLLNPQCFEFQIIQYKAILLVFLHFWHSRGCSISYVFSNDIRSGLNYSEH